MRRCLPGLLMALFLFCTACSSAASGPADPVFTFQCEVNITRGDAASKATLDCSGQGMLRLTNDRASFLWNGEGFSIGGSDLEKGFSSCPLPKDSTLVFLHDLIVYSSSEGALTHSGGSTWKGSLNGCEFSITVDARGFPQRLSAPQKEFTVDFQNFVL